MLMRKYQNVTTERFKSIQIEITTRCNLNCTYCAGRLYDNQRDMPFDEFKEILDKYMRENERPSRIIIQGEGEPTLHPDLYKMATYAKRYKLFTSLHTNGLHADREGLVKHFDEIYVSLDTIDPQEGKRIGRLNIPKVLESMLFFHNSGIKAALFIIEMQGINEDKALQAWAKEHGVYTIITTLNKKEEYVKVYKNNYQIPLTKSETRFNCPFIYHRERDFFTIDGKHLPCCYIKDTSTFTSIDDLKQAIDDDVCPQCCKGCRFAYIEPNQHKTPS